MEFEEFPKMARLSRRIIITEKIDGTNAAVVIETLEGHEAAGAIWQRDGLALFAQSRTRFITPNDDNFGFAAWACDHAEELVAGLGVGRHFGEWWGQGIQRGYGLAEKRFSLFNTTRWLEERPSCCHVVPVLFDGVWNGEEPFEILEFLRREGSQAAPGFMKPEGIVVYHVAGKVGFKKTLEKDEMSKQEAERRARFAPMTA